MYVLYFSFFIDYKRQVTYVSCAINDFQNMPLTLSGFYIKSLFLLFFKRIFKLDREIGEIFIYSYAITSLFSFLKKSPISKS